MSKPDTENTGDNPTTLPTLTTPGKLQIESPHQTSPRPPSAKPFMYAWRAILHNHINELDFEHDRRTQQLTGNHAKIDYLRAGGGQVDRMFRDASRRSRPVKMCGVHWLTRRSVLAALSSVQIPRLLCRNQRFPRQRRRSPFFFTANGRRSTRREVNTTAGNILSNYIAYISDA